MASIGDQFKGLDMSYLIGAPLSAAAESSMFLARNTAEFINQIGFDGDNKVRNVLFKFQKTEPDPDGNMSSQEMAVDVPLLAIVPIPNLQIDEVNIVFDMEVKISEKATSNTSANASASVKHGWGFGRAAVSGNVATAVGNTRTTDNSAKYHVDVTATNHGIPEGLARVLDMIAANIAPNLVSNTPVDRMGNALSGTRRERNLRLRQLREELPILEAGEAASKETFEIKLNELLRQGDAMRNRIHIRLQGEMRANKDKEDKMQDLTAIAEQNTQYWDDFRASIRNTVVATSLAASGDAASNTNPSLLHLRGNPIKEPAQGEAVNGLDEAFNVAIEAQREVNATGKEIANNKVRYNNVLRGVDENNGIAVISTATGGTG